MYLNCDMVEMDGYIFAALVVPVVGAVDIMLEVILKIEIIC